MFKIFKAFALIAIVGFVSTKHSAHKDTDAYPSVAQQNKVCKINCMKKVNFCHGITTEACSQKFSSCMADCQDADDLTKAVESSYLMNVQAMVEAAKNKANPSNNKHIEGDSDEDNSDDDQDEMIVNRKNRNDIRDRDVMRKNRDANRDRDVMRKNRDNIRDRDVMRKNRGINRDRDVMRKNRDDSRDNFDWDAAISRFDE